MLRGDAVAHRHVRDLPELLRPGDLLVLNDTKVLPARLVGRRAGTGGKWEGLFLREPTPGVWEILSQTRGYPAVGERFACEPAGLELELVGRTPDRHWLVRPHPSGTPAELLAAHGQVPLPPYIRKGRGDKSDVERYQTVYATTAGSVAAPTAGLHFTPALLERLAERAVRTATVTLHVGLGTFAPVTADDPTAHPIHAEWCAVPGATVAAVRDTKANGGRVVAVGTTSVRTLESASQSGEVRPWAGDTALFIHPPYRFRTVDALLTNFHLPRTTLLLLVQALAGAEPLRRAYEAAVAERYRFFSYGDAMLVLPGGD